MDSIIWIICHQARKKGKQVKLMQTNETHDSNLKQNGRNIFQDDASALALDDYEAKHCYNVYRRLFST